MRRRFRRRTYRGPPQTFVERLGKSVVTVIVLGGTIALIALAAMFRWGV